MMRRPRLLLVTQHLGLLNALTGWLQAGYEVVTVSSFLAAKRWLDTGPDLVLTEFKLAEYNGLHLALRAQAAGIPTIVIGPEDRVLERECAAFGATRIGPVLSRASVLAAVAERLTSGAANLPTGGVPGQGELAWRAFRDPAPLRDSFGRTLLPN
jgi:hypothetical protein